MRLFGNKIQSYILGQHIKSLFSFGILLLFFRGTPGYCNNLDSSQEGQDADASSNEAVKQLAVEHFKKGIDLLRDNNYEKAAKEFERANELYVTKNGLYNLANCYWKMQRYVDAANKIVILKDRYSEQFDDNWHSDIFEFERKIEEFVLRVTFEVNVDGAQVFVDGNYVGVTPIESPIILNLSEHEILVSRESYEPQSLKISAKDGYNSNLNVTLYKVAQNEESLAPMEPVDDENKTETSASPKRVWTWVAYGVAGATGLAAIITGTKALSLSRDVRDNCTNNICPADQKSDADKSRSLSVATNVLIGLTAVGVAVGTILFFTEGKTKKERAAIIPSIIPDGAGMTLIKTF